MITRIYHHTIRLRTMLIFIALLLIVLILVRVSQTVHAASEQPSRSGQHILNVYDGGIEKGILTSAGTLGEALREADITLADNDITEPGIDTKLVASSYEVTIYRARPVLVVDGVSHITVMTPYQTTKQIAAQAGITLHDEDTARLEASPNVVADGALEKLVITRATAFTFVFYGQTSTAYTRAKTVGDMLKEKNIVPQSTDTITPGLATPIKAGMRVELWHNGKQTVTVEEDVPYPTKTIYDANQPTSYRKVETAGIKGRQTVRYEMVMKNGKEVSREALEKLVTKQPSQEVVIIGSKFDNTFDGSFADALARLRSCEGGYSSNTGNGYYGAYQFDIGTWGGYQGYANASQAPPAVQDQKAWETYQRRGWQPWPSCSQSQGLQDIYR